MDAMICGECVWMMMVFMHNACMCLCVGIGMSSRFSGDDEDFENSREGDRFCGELSMR